jgi:hypothetical protein
VSLPVEQTAARTDHGNDTPLSPWQPLATVVAMRMERSTHKFHTQKKVGVEHSMAGQANVRAECCDVLVGQMDRLQKVLVIIKKFERLGRFQEGVCHCGRGREPVTLQQTV